MCMNKREIEILTEANERRNHTKDNDWAFRVTSRGAWMGYRVVPVNIISRKQGVSVGILKIHE